MKLNMHCTRNCNKINRGRFTSTGQEREQGVSHTQYTCNISNTHETQLKPTIQITLIGLGVILHS